MYGLLLMVEAVRQLRASDGQVGRDVALAHGNGGVLSAAQCTACSEQRTTV